MRLDYQSTLPAGRKGMLGIEQAVRESPLEPGLLELVRQRASQINGCAFCLHMHTRDARKHGEIEERLYLLDAWRESPLYSERERAALAWCEAVTRLDPQHGVPDEVYEQALAVFSEEELIDLDLAVATINAWNRLAIPFRAEPGHYRPGKHKTGD